MHTRGKYEHLSNSVRKNLLTRFRLCLGNLREGLEKQGFVLDWMLSESRENSMIKYLNNSYL